MPHDVVQAVIKLLSWYGLEVARPPSLPTHKPTTSIPARANGDGPSSARRARVCRRLRARSKASEWLRLPINHVFVFYIIHVKWKQS